jgi:NAD(P)-dependent dehydrogenase (short-subunit alcohol dehydrogenase family)
MSKFSIWKFLHSQLCVTLPYPTTNLTGQTIIITGSNTGLGLEAARHFVRLDASRVILAVRNAQKGKAAAESIHKSTQRSGVAEVWELDLDSYASVQRFAARVIGELEVLHAVVENAGILSRDFLMSEEDERNITVNVVSTIMLGILRLPKLRETASKTGTKTVLKFTGSWMHFLPKFKERKASCVFKELAKKESAQMMDR